MGINRAASTISSGGVRCPHQCAGKNICPSIYLLRNVQEAGKCFRVLKHPGDMSSRILTKWEEIQTIMRVHLFMFNKVKLFWFLGFSKTVGNNGAVCAIFINDKNNFICLVAIKCTNTCRTI